MLRIGVDIGGTFTDFVLQGPDGTRTLKIPTSQPDPAEAVLAGFQRLLEESGLSADAIEGVLHAQAKTIRVDWSPPTAWQLDGDVPPEAARPVAERREVECLPGVLPVLLPPQGP